MAIMESLLSKRIRGLNKVLNSSKILDIDSKVLDVGWAAVMLAYYDGPTVVESISFVTSLKF